MRYNENQQRDDYDPSCVASEALDDRDEPGLNVFDQSGFNKPEDAVAHL